MWAAGIVLGYSTMLKMAVRGLAQWVEHHVQDYHYWKGLPALSFFPQFSMGYSIVSNPEITGNDIIATYFRSLHLQHRGHCDEGKFGNAVLNNRLLLMLVHIK